MAVFAFQPTDALLVLAGVVITQAAVVYKQHRDDVNAKRLNVGSVDTADAEVVFNAMTGHLTRLEAQLAEALKEASTWRAEADSQRLKAIENQERAESMAQQLAAMQTELTQVREQLRLEEAKRARRPATGG